MSEPIPAIQSAYINLGEVQRWMEYARDDFEEGDLKECVEYITWSIDALTSAKAKIENHMKESK